MSNLVQMKTLRDIAVLALAYFVTGWIGISLAVPPGYASIIWPASGVALCALLARGKQLLPGIWLGSFVLNVLAGLESSVEFDHAWPVFGIAAALGVGASLQAMAGLTMARRFADGIEISHLPRVLRAALLVVALPCTIAPTIGVGTLFVTGAVTTDLVLQNWLTWYSGDLLGVLLIIPILLLSVWSPVAVSWRGRSLQGANALVAISLIATLLLTFYAWKFVSEREYDQAEISLGMMADDTVEALSHRLQVYQTALQSGAAFVSIAGDVTPSRWRDYVAHMEIARSYPGMRGLGMFEEVPDKDFPVFRAQFEREFGDQYMIHPIVDRERHFIINRIEPLANNVAALGLDLAFEQGRRDAIERSKTSVDAVLTRPIVLVQDHKQGAGFLLMLPVFDNAGRPSGRWVYSPLVAEDLLAALSPRQGGDFALQVYHANVDGSETLLYSTGTVADYPKFEVRRRMILAGQPIVLRWTSLPQFDHRVASSAPNIALASGFMITALLGALLITFLRRESHVLHEVNEATAELEERNRMLEMAEATAHIGHWHLDLQSNQIQWSDEVHRMHGLKPGQTPDLERAIEFYHPEDRASVQQSIETALSDCQPYQFKARLLTMSGETRHVEVRGRVTTNAEAEPIEILGVIIDRTDETIMRGRLTETIEKAQAADKAKTSFLANMSHEIRTPMNGVIGFTELALAEEEKPAQRRRLQMIADSGNAMLRLLNDLLDFAKIEANQMAIVNELADLRHTLRSCQRLMEPVAMKKNLSLLLEVDPELPARVLIDKMRLRQIVLNLVGNALKFTGEGEVRISASVSKGRADHADKIVIKVSDTGIGIPEDRLESIFGKFTQADETTARRYGGTGLGLPISSELASLMGGDLRVESEFGRGSAFILSLPLASATKGGDAENRPSPSGGCGAASPLRILVAEDNPINQELTVAMVKKAGHHCDLARDGQEAIDAVARSRKNGEAYDLVLMDMQMPRVDGLEASRVIRGMGIDAKALPIVAVTANAYAEDIQKCLKAGMQAHLAKPLRLKALSDEIERWSSHRGMKVSAADSAFEEEANPRLRAMFEDRKAAAVKAIKSAIDGQQVTASEREEIAGLLHKTAGVAAYFGQAELGEECRRLQRELVAELDDERTSELLQNMLKLLAPELP